MSEPSSSFGLQIDGAQERKLLAKLDLFVIPIIMLVYLSCFLDRSNIGNVKVAGMPEDIHASPGQFSIGVSIFYATYVAFETPWAIAVKKFTPRYVISALCVVWSLTTIFSGFTSSPGALYATRLVLGACEGGLFPALNIYLTMIYRREEMARRVAYLFVCTALAGAFGGLFAYAILKMDGIGGFAGWRWVYIIEGILSILIGLLVWFGLPNEPAKAYFLSADEKRLMGLRNTERGEYMGSEEFSWKEVRIAVLDPHVCLSGCIQFCQDIMLYGFSTFLPSIIKSLGYSSTHAQYLTIPVYLCGGLCFVLIATLSDKFRLRSAFILVANFFGIIGYTLIICHTPGGVKFFGTFLCAMAVFTGPGLNVAWLNVNIAPQARRAAAIGLQQTIGNTAGIVAGQIYRRAPFLLGNTFSLSTLCVAQVLICANVLYLTRRDNEKAQVSAGKDDDRKVQTGDRSIDFKYHL